MYVFDVNTISLNVDFHSPHLMLLMSDLSIYLSLLQFNVPMNFRILYRNFNCWTSRILYNFTEEEMSLSLLNDCGFVFIYSYIFFMEIAFIYEHNVIIILAIEQFAINLLRFVKPTENSKLYRMFYVRNWLAPFHMKIHCPSCIYGHPLGYMWPMAHTLYMCFFLVCMHT